MELTTGWRITWLCLWLRHLHVGDGSRGQCCLIDMKRVVDCTVYRAWPSDSVYNSCLLRYLEHTIENNSIMEIEKYLDG